MSELDYERFGRQIALPEIGAPGQRALATRAVRFAAPAGLEAMAEQAARMHTRAGGVVTERAEIVVVMQPAQTPPGQLGIAAAHAVEAARRVLGQPAREIPADLVEHLEVR